MAQCVIPSFNENANRAWMGINEEKGFKKDDNMIMMMCFELMKKTDNYFHWLFEKS